MTKKKWPNYLLLLISVGVSILLVEWACGYFYKHLPEKFNNGKRMVEIYRGNQPAIKSKIESHPYLLYQNTKNFHSLGFQQHNSLRYRNQAFSLEKPKEQVRILALGGSTTYMYPYIPNPEQCWTGQLEAILKEEIDSQTLVINGGISFGTSAELLSSYVFRHQYLKPDSLILHTGGNDIASLMFENYDPEYTHFRAAGSGLHPRKFEGTLLRKSRFFRLFYAYWLNTTESVYQAIPLPFDQLDREEVFKRVENNESPGFRRNLETLIQLAQKQGTQVVLFGYLQARAEDLAKNVPVLKGLEPALVVGLEKHYAIMQELSKKYNIPFIIPEQDLFEDEWFLDNCHLNEEGDSVKGQILFDHFLSHHHQYFPNS